MMITTYRFVIACVFVARWTGVLSAETAAPTLCSDKETILFSCPSGKKIISICASNLSPDGGSVQYRFGTAGAPEIELPEKPEEWRKSKVSRHLVFVAGDGIYVAFAKPPYRYVVYSATSGHWGMKDGVGVKKKTVNSLLIFMHTKSPFEN